MSKQNLGAALPLPSPRMLSDEQAAAYCGIKKRLFGSLVDAGFVSVVRIGGIGSKRPRRLFDRRDLDAAIDALKLAGGIDEYLAHQNTSARMPMTKSTEART